MVAGFTPVNGLVRLDGIAADPAAVMRGGDMLVDPQTGAITSIPWSDGSGDKLVITPRVIDCGVAASPVETPAGFEIAYANGVRMQTHNFASERKLPVLADVDFPSAKSLLWLPPEMIHDSGGGYFRPPKEYVVTGIGINSGTWHHQHETGNPYVTQPWWAVNSWARYHDSKANNCPGKNYMTGKEAHLIAPSLVLWKQGRILATIRGIIEWIDPVTFRKAFSLAEIQPYLGAFDKISVDATVGYSSVGANSNATYCIWVWVSSFSVSQTETGASMSVYSKSFTATDTDTPRYMAVYNRDTSALLANGKTDDFNLSTTPGWVESPFSTGPTLVVNGTGYALGAFSKTSEEIDSNFMYYYYDSATCYTYTRAAGLDSPPNPFPYGGWAYNFDTKTSIYLTTAAIGQPAMRRWGGVPHMRVGRGGW